jgi:hypothetical protein
MRSVPRLYNESCELYDYSEFELAVDRIRLQSLSEPREVRN